MLDVEVQPGVFLDTGLIKEVKLSQPRPHFVIPNWF